MPRFANNVLAAVMAVFIAATSFTAVLTVPAAPAQASAEISAPALA